MTLKTRRLIFYGFCVLFILVGSGVVSYSQGWRVYIENCEIEQLRNCEINFQKTGAVYVETIPRDVVIKIGNKTFHDKSGILQKGTLISELLPKNYKVEISKDSYLPYYKNIRVQPSLVAELFDIILIPEEINDRTRVVSNLKGDVFIEKSNDDKKIILKNSAKGIYYLYDLNNLSSVLNVSAAFGNFKKEPIVKMSFHPFDSNRFLIATKDGLYALDVSRLQLESVLSSLPTIWTVKNPNVYYIKEVKCQMLNVKCQALNSYNLVVKTETELTPLPEKIGEIASLDVSENQNYAAVINDGAELYLFNQSDKSFKKIVAHAKKFAFSPDSKKIAVFDGNSRVDIYFLEDYSRGVNKKTGDTIRLAIESSQSLENIFWYKDSIHLLLQYPDHIKFGEIDDRLPLNYFNILNNFSDFFYNQNNNQIYFIRQNSLYSFQLEK